MSRWVTKAVVLRSEPSGESDLRVEFLTARQGRLWAVAKGALRSRKRFAGGFDLGQVHTVGFLVSGRGGRVLIEHSLLEEAFPRFREDYRRLARASLLLELVSLTVGEGEPAAPIFQTLVRGLKRLHTEPDQEQWCYIYAFRLLALAGWRPEFKQCVRCPSPLQGKERWFSPAAGGVLCPECWQNLRAGPEPDPLALVISAETTNSLATTMTVSERLLSRYHLSPLALREAHEILDRFTRHHLPRTLRSLSVLPPPAPRAQNPPPCPPR